MMATSEKKMVKKSTAEWFFHNIHVHNKDHKETGDVPKSTKPKVNWFCRHCTDVSGALAFLNSPDVNSVCPSCWVKSEGKRKSRKFTETSKIKQSLSHRHNDGDGAGAVRTTVKPDDATPPPTPPSSVDARELPSTSGSVSEEGQYSDYYSDDGGSNSKDGIRRRHRKSAASVRGIRGTELPLRHPFLSQDLPLPLKVKKEVKVPLRRPAKLHSLVSRPTIVDTPTFLSVTFDRKEDKDLKVAGLTEHTALIAGLGWAAHKDVKEGEVKVPLR